MVKLSLGLYDTCQSVVPTPVKRGHHSVMYYIHLYDEIHLIVHDHWIILYIVIHSHCASLKSTVSIDNTELHTHIIKSSNLLKAIAYFLLQGIARTQSPTTKNYVLELPTFGVIAKVSQTEVQWKGLTLEEPPTWSRCPLYQVSMLKRGTVQLQHIHDNKLNVVQHYHRFTALF